MTMTQSNGQTPLLPRYAVLETEDGLMISESRVSLFDVMEAHDSGDSIYQICMTFNLSPLQVRVAFEYIIQHRDQLAPRLAKAIRLREEQEQYYQTVAAELDCKIAQLPMTPRRAAFYALHEKNRNLEAGQQDAVHSQ